MTLRSWTDVRTYSIRRLTGFREDANLIGLCGEKELDDVPTVLLYL
jgi:hypothetical protein